jgi:hypothetical protein
LAVVCSCRLFPTLTVEITSGGDRRGSCRLSNSQSRPTPAIALGVQIQPDGSVAGAGGYFIQVCSSDLILLRHSVINYYAPCAAGPQWWRIACISACLLSVPSATCCHEQELPWVVAVSELISRCMAALQLLCGNAKPDTRLYARYVSWKALRLKCMLADRPSCKSSALKDLVGQRFTESCPPPHLHSKIMVSSVARWQQGVRLLGS